MPLSDLCMKEASRAARARSTLDQRTEKIRDSVPSEDLPDHEAQVAVEDISSDVIRMNGQVL